ncbi:ADP-ribosylation factor-like protein 6-interacting protein 1 [Dermatophagoides pteronyssinus]|uniref:ADP-ribosylation factor-like protein 6-interacting protein 1 n=1 Tax=Dermatophagoides pteronyssinus TaxID=6956 RepID=A0ABQ8IXL2_DERPT|nr:ADP-ribosylation factor-like protein 6-interacting protein 1 [Dermatophagoides pteronyssinus]
MSEFDKTVEYIRQKLNPIRDIVVRMHSILIWEKSYHAPCIIMFITFIFMCLWLIEVPIISKICFMGIIATLIDYFLPFINEIFSLPKWNDSSEKLFNNECHLIAKTWLNVKEFYQLVCSWKYSKTKLYYSTLLTVLMVIAWIGTQIHNLLLLYLSTMFIVLYPGLSHYNMIEDFFLNIRQWLQSSFSKHQPSTTAQSKKIK